MNQLNIGILDTIKKLLGLDTNYDVFDMNIITHINSALMQLQQLGVGPENGMYITGFEETWDDFFDSAQMMEAAKDYIYIQVRMVFDPPTSSFVMDSLQRRSDMLEQRLRDQARLFDAQKGKYVDPKIDGNEDENEQAENSGKLQNFGHLGYAVHIERDGITPIDDIGQNVVMDGGR